MKILNKITIIFFVFLFICFCFCVGSCDYEENKTDKKQEIEYIKTTQKPEIKRNDMTIDKYLEYMSNKVLSKETNTNKNKFVSSETGNNKIAYITFNANDNFTNNWIISYALIDIEKYLKEIIKDKEVLNLKSISMNFKFPLIDKYGNSKDGTILILRISIESLKKINWNNFIRDDFKNIAEYYFIHPSLKK